MKITLEHYDKTIAVETKADDLTIDQVRDDLLIPVLLGAGFDDQNVNDLFFERDSV